MAKEDNIVSKRDQLQVLAPRVKMPRIHKLRWKDENVTRELVRKISVLRSSIVDASKVTSAHDKDVKLLRILDEQNSTNENSFHDTTSPFAVEMVEKVSKTRDGAMEQEPIAQNYNDAQYQSRKPDALYVILISQDYVPTTSLSNISETRFSEYNFAASKLMSEEKCPQNEELHECSSSVFFPVASQENLAAKRKLSFEYIQEVSKLGVCK